MDGRTSSRELRVALVSMPWLAPYRPSIQLGALRAWLSRELPSVQVDAIHAHLEVTRHMRYDAVKLVADGVLSSWVGETLSAYLLFPERRPLLDRFLRFLTEGKEPRVDLRADLLQPYAAFIDELAEGTDWAAYDLVGLSVSLCQTLSSVLLARRIRRRTARPLLVLGGPAVSGRMGRSFLEAFPELDCAVQGEGELPLLELLQCLLAGGDLGQLRGVVTRDERSEPDGRRELEDLDQLPCPDYEAYFRTLRALPAADEVRQDLEVPLEGSRGCWWDRRHCRANASCQFCNLNLQWKRYREKSVSRQLEQLRQLIGTGAGSRYLLVDNVTRRRAADAEQLFRRLKDEIPQQLELYMEARANVAPGLWQLLHEAGVTHCQVGIESLCTSVLRKIGKGTTTIMNLEAMKEMERWGIANPGNILYDLPEMTVEEIDVIIEVVRLARAYHPLSATRFFLNYGSPYYDRLIRRPAPGVEPLPDRNYRAWQVLLPPEIDGKLFLSEREYEVELEGMAEAVERLQLACNEWYGHYWKLREEGLRWLLWSEPAAGAPGRTVVHDRRQETAQRHLLEGAEAELLAFFRHRRPVATCYRELAHLTAERIDEHLQSLAARGLVFREGREALSLPLEMAEPTCGEGSALPA